MHSGQPKYYYYVYEPHLYRHLIKIDRLLCFSSGWFEQYRGHHKLWQKYISCNNKIVVVSLLISHETCYDKIYFD